MGEKSIGLKILDGFLALFGVVENVDVDGVVRSVYAPGGKRRVGIYHRANNTYIYQEEVFNDLFTVMRWEPFQAGPKDGCSTPEEAMAAARKALPWLWEIPE
ncbi:MAG: hypothetical protein A2X35_09790 [Elusimicrobia bacterium GWA2_61_42]|nr:MAG: hypothetical protein A2X35_09790 [Elusimicrobia bacterium GWA2_61_42]OGR76438.1 MAG: hypothetical protein A2X38_12215 [Elusimicrobia bacterium GWC2_61_25]